MVGSGKEYGTFGDGRSSDAGGREASLHINIPETKIYAPESKDAVFVVFLVTMWYFLNTLYNIDNKNAVKMLPLPWTVSTIQLMTGWFWFVPLWISGMRKKPEICNWPVFWIKIAPQGIFHFAVHAGACLSMAAGAVSFTQIVKAGEPVITAIFAGVMLGEVFHPLTYMSLIPVVGGVSLAAIEELSFNWVAFWGAMVSNLGSSLRNIFAKKVMADPKEVGDNIDDSNMYAILTMISTVISIIITIFVEAPEVSREWESATSRYGTWTIATMILRSGIWYYAYNEVAFITLGRLNAVTHAVVNTLKRVVIIIAAVIVFQTPVTLLGVAGSFTAVAGTLLYSITKKHFH